MEADLLVAEVKAAEVVEISPIPWNLQTAPSQELGRTITQWISTIVG
jgi:hypothetical protein